MNCVNIIGRIASEISYIPFDDNRSVRKFSLAFKDKVKVDGEDDSYFIECEAWDSVGERLDKYCKKGEKIAISGRLVQHKYVRRDGSKGSLIKIIVGTIEFFEPKKDKKSNDQSSLDKVVEDDDLPF